MPIKSHILGGGISGGVINFDIYTLIFGNKMETGMGDRKYNEEKYLKLQVEDDEEKNALICDQLADESLMWNPGEAVYWRKKAIEKIENCYGKGDFRNTAYYDKIDNVAERRNVHLCVVYGVHPVIDCNVPHVMIREKYLDISTCFKIIPPQS